MKPSLYKIETPTTGSLFQMPKPSGEWLHDDLNHHFIRYTKKTFRKLAHDCRVRIHRLKYMFHWTCPVKLAIRAKEAAIKSEPTPPQVPSRMINSACYAASRFEQLTLSRLGMPFGSSLLAVGSQEG